MAQTCALCHGQPPPLPSRINHPSPLHMHRPRVANALPPGVATPTCQPETSPWVSHVSSLRCSAFPAQTCPCLCHLPHATAAGLCYLIVAVMYMRVMWFTRRKVSLAAAGVVVLIDACSCDDDLRTCIAFLCLAPATSHPTPSTTSRQQLSPRCTLPPAAKRIAPPLHSAAPPSTPPIPTLLCPAPSTARAPALSPPPQHTSRSSPCCTACIVTRCTASNHAHRTHTCARAASAPSHLCLRGLWHALALSYQCASASHALALPLPLADCTRP
jgi:hypothetical protein